SALVIDPDRRTVETRLDDNRVPPQYQLLLDSADVEVSSTEFGISSLLVGRRRYDYQKDLALAGFYTSRGYGFDAGFQLHGGTPIDANLYRQNLFAYYSLEQLDSTFENKQQPALRTHGSLGGFGLRFNSYDAFWFENPAGSHHLRLFFDGYDRSLGGDFGFVQGGGSLAYTLALRPDTVLAGQVLNGYSAATGSGPIPNQGLFSLGGFRSIRGIGAEEQLGKDIFIVRAELRHMLPWRLDWNLEEMLIARRLQAKVFVDAGRVESSSRRLYDPSGFAVGVGGGLNLFYDFMGFFPTTFYLDVATRADEGGPLQVLFGVGQPF
ncbi:MAG TPA: BamA/TamA family outer membrane protein, partial [Candidatus Binatia bacterium]|nr:BamA/TamA family outer membrane protein [Candidatus Binatia bacterium]